MSGDESWREVLGDEDFLDVRIERRDGRIAGFVLNYTAVIEDEFVEVCRYDTCHGHLHVHREWLANASARDLEDPKRPARSYLDRLEAARADIHENWRAYRAKMELRK